MDTNTHSPEHFIVTGAAGGIGAATASELLRRGHKVTSFDIRPSTDPLVHSVVVDVANEVEVARAVENAASEHGQITGLVACHGVRGSYVPALEISVDQIRRLYDIHVVGAFVVSREVVRRLEGAPASIVLISSTTAYGGWANQVDYGPAKAAERQLMENLAIEWAPLGIRVNAVAPGHTMTPMVQDMVDSQAYDLSAVEQRMPLGRLAEPREMAESIAWLLCDASFVTGQCLPVDGGWTVVGK